MVFQIGQLKFRIVIALVALVLVAAMPVSAYNNGFYYVVRQNIKQGATVFIGEQGLDITEALASANTAGGRTGLTIIGWWASAAEIYITAPTVSVDTAKREMAFYVTQAEFDGFEGQWYLVDPTANQIAVQNAGAVFNVKAPKIDVSIRDVNQNDADVSNKAIPTGAELVFQIGTNMYTVTQDTGQRTSKATPVGFNESDGFINVVVKPASGAVLGALYTCGERDPATLACIDTGVARSIRMLNINTQPYIWGETGVDPDFDWYTDARTGPGDTGQKIYPPGTYVVSAESKLNNMYDNYRAGGAAYTGRTVSETKTITLVLYTVNITANKDSVVRSKPFSVTITGKPSTLYNVWVKSTQNMVLNAYNNGPPVVTKYQVLVRDGHPVTADYQYQNGGGNTIVPDAAFGSCPPINPYATSDASGYPDCWFSYAQITTSTAGTRTIEFSTSANTKAQKFTIRVERNDNDNNYAEGDFLGDEVDVYVEKDAASQIGVFRPLTHIYYQDFNGNGVWNGAVIDRAYNFGITGDIPVSGDWNHDGADEIGVFRPSTHLFYLDYSGNGAWNGAVVDRAYNFGITGDIPITGDWNHDGISEIGVFRNSTHLFYLDYSGNGAWNVWTGLVADRQYNFGITGDIPITGDWNHDGADEIGVFRPSTRQFYLDYSGNGAWNGAAVDRTYNFGIFGDIPITGDWDNNGTYEIGLFRPSNHLFYLDYSGNGAWDGTGLDRSYNFGITGDKPVTGKWA